MDRYLRKVLVETCFLELLTQSGFLEIIFFVVVVEPIFFSLKEAENESPIF